MKAELGATVSWQNGVKLQGKIEMDYLADIDPWLIHMTFVVADVQDSIDVERMMLIRGMGSAPKGSWINVVGAPIRMGAGSRFIRFRRTDENTGTWADFDVKRKELQSFLDDTDRLVDLPAEKAALAAYIDKSLGELSNE